MRDKYNRITPDFEAWKKLGWSLMEIHENSYTFSKDGDNDPFEFEQLYISFEGSAPEVYKERISVDKDRNMLLEFSPEEQAQVDADIDSFYQEMSYSTI